MSSDSPEKKDEKKLKSYYRTNFRKYTKFRKARAASRAAGRQARKLFSK